MPNGARVERLTLTDFRNYPALRLETRARTVALVGPNGAGKTNLLEAISLLAPGRGLRGAEFRALARHGGAGRWAVASALEGGVALGTSWDGDTDETRIVAIDGSRRKSSGAFAEYVRLLWVTPAMDRLFAGPAGDRRRFLDRLTAMFDAGHGSRVLSFEKAMRDRNLLLHQGSRDSRWLSGLEAQMAEHGAAIAAARLAAIGALSAHMGKDGAFPSAIVSAEGDLEAAITVKPAVQAEDGYRGALAESRTADAAAGRALKGPHRSEFRVIHKRKSMAAEFCSTGEQKALLIGIVLAQARAVMESAGSAPILLLDEIAAHLDRERRVGLFGELAQLGGQVWMSGTDEALFRDIGIDAEVFRIAGGTLTGHA